MSWSPLGQGEVGQEQRVFTYGTGELATEYTVGTSLLVHTEIIVSSFREVSSFHNKYVCEMDTCAF